MDKINVDREIKYISGVLSDIETIELPWSEFNQASICYDWDAALDRLKELKNTPLDTEQNQAYESILERIKMRKGKIRELQYTYPDFIET